MNGNVPIAPIPTLRICRGLFLEIPLRLDKPVSCAITCVLSRFFFVNLHLGTDVNISFVKVPIESLVHPLCVIPDSGGDRDIYFVVLPKRNWSRFFGERIIITNNI